MEEKTEAPGLFQSKHNSSRYKKHNPCETVCFLPIVLWYHMDFPFPIMPYPGCHLPQQYPASWHVQVLDIVYDEAMANSRTPDYSLPEEIPQTLRKT